MHDGAQAAQPLGNQSSDRAAAAKQEETDNCSCASDSNINHRSRHQNDCRLKSATSFAPQQTNIQIKRDKMRARIGLSLYLTEILGIVAIVVAICKVSQVHSGTDLSYKQGEEFQSRLETNLELDDDATRPEEQQIRIDLGAKTEPLINLDLVQDDGVDNDYEDGDEDDDNNNNSENDSDSDESTKSISGDNFEQLGPSWCNVDAELDGHCRRLIAHNYSNSLEICGSDGQLYDSICDFRRRSCVAAADDNQHHLLRMESKSFCLEANRELGLCRRRDEYEQFKLALLHEFNGDLRLMFKHFDSNGNDLIEARELWRSANERICDGARQQCDELGAELALGRHLGGSSCSFSHLLLFENRTSFEWSQFEAAFQAFGSTGTGVRVGEPPIESTRSRVLLALAESRLVRCLPDDNSVKLANHSQLDCQWTRYGTNVAALRDEHLSLARDSRRVLSLQLRDAQLYLSGPYKCSCGSKQQENSLRPPQIEHLVEIQILAQPRVSIRPQFQWSLPGSRVAFECQHDFIDTNFDSTTSSTSTTKRTELTSEAVKINAPLDYQLKWWRETDEAGGRRLRILDNKEYDNDQGHNTKTTQLDSCSTRASMPAASGKLVLERTQVNDSGRYYCQVDQFDSLNVRRFSLDSDNLPPAETIMSQSNFGRLLIQADTQASLLATAEAQEASDSIKHLWSFHGNGISIYRLRPDESQDLELVREITGRSKVGAEVEGNWNQLTLCGDDPKTEQVFVTCEWSDNALLVEVPLAISTATTTTLADDNNLDAVDDDDQQHQQQNRRHRPNLIAPQKYVYIGQPNLNRVIVMDGHAHEVVAIINTEPQPRKLFAFKPNKIHLSKWVRRRLSPMANARWLKAIDDEQQQQQQQQSGQQQQSRAHPLELTPKSSRLYSDKRPTEATRLPEPATGSTRRQRREEQTRQQPVEQTQSRLIQHDIWLLCYGRPLEVEPVIVVGSRTDDSVMKKDNQELSPSLRSFRTNRMPDSTVARTSWPSPFAPLVSTWPLIRPRWAPAITERSPHAISASSPYSNPSIEPKYSANKEARLRNRKSVQIIQSTFFPPFGKPKAMHQHNEQQQREQINSHPSSSSPSSVSQAVGRFKRLSVLTTHYVIANHGMSSIYRDNGNSSSSPSLVGSDETKMSRRKKMPHGPQYDLVQSLSVPRVPYSLQSNPKFKLHHAYVTHYDQRRLYRIAMDGYRYDREIDLQNCDPLSIVLASQGLIIVQCRSPITHKLIGQLVLDELSSQIIQFNDNVQAHESCLTPDNRYLISIHTNQSSTIYVQSVKVDGLSLLYIIETALETTQCSFVWRDGYYAAIFVAINRRDKQSDLLSLRIADSRLELIVRVPGLMTSSVRHKEPLNVEPNLQIVTLSTDSGVHVIDLEENRIVQSIDHHHQRSSPTLLWV